MQRVGRRPLLLASVIGALSSLVLTGYGLNTGMTIVSSFAILIFVMQVFFSWSFLRHSLDFLGLSPLVWDPFHSS
jgi:hypothetical protein